MVGYLLEYMDDELWHSRTILEGKACDIPKVTRTRTRGVLMWMEGNDLVESKIMYGRKKYRLKLSR